MSLPSRLIPAVRRSLVPSSTFRNPASIHHAVQSRTRSALACAVYDDVFETPLPLDSHSLSPSHTNAVVSILGADRIGIIRTFSATAEAAGADVIQSRMALLGGDFAIIVHVHLPHPDDAALLKDRLSHDLPGFEVAVRSTTPHRSHDLTQKWMIRLDSPDAPGIVAAVSEEIASVGGNILEMQTETNTASSGRQTLRMHGKLALEDARVDGLADALTQVEHKFGASIALGYIPEVGQRVRF